MSGEDFESKATALLTSLGQFLQLGELQFDEEDDTCTLALDGTIDINITPHGEEETLILHHVVGTLPPENRQEILEQLLEANLFWAGTKGATISIERRSGSIFIMRSLTLYSSNGELLTGEALGNAIADLANAANHVRSLLSGSVKSNCSLENEDQKETKKEEGFDISILD